MNSHIRKMLGPGIWGTHVELFAAATYFQITVYIVKSNRCVWEVLLLWALNRTSNTSCAQIDVEVSSDHIILNYSTAITATMTAKYQARIVSVFNKPFLFCLLLWIYLNTNHAHSNYAHCPPTHSERLKQV